MKKITFLFVIISLLFGCRIQKQLPQTVVLKDSVRIVERLVPVQLPADSSSLTALFECDSTNKVILKALNEEKTKRISSLFKFTSGKDAKLDYKSRVKPDTVYLPAKETSTIRDKPIYIDVPSVTNKLNWWQKVLMWEGVVFTILLILSIYKRIKP